MDPNAVILGGQAESNKNLPLFVFQLCTQKFLQFYEPSIQLFICQLRQELFTFPNKCTQHQLLFLSPSPMPSIELGHLTKVNIAVLFSPSWGSLIVFFVSEISLFVIFVTSAAVWMAHSCSWISSGFPNICNKSYYVLVWSYPIVLYPTAVWEWFWQVWAQLHKLGEWGNTPSGVGRRGKGGLTLSVGSPVVCQSTSPEPACINFSTLSRSYTFVGCKLLSADQSRPIFVKSQLFGKVSCLHRTWRQLFRRTNQIASFEMESLFLSDPGIMICHRQSNIYVWLFLIARLSFSQIKSWVALSSLVVTSRIGDISTYLHYMMF